MVRYRMKRPAAADLHQHPCIPKNLKKKPRGTLYAGLKISPVNGGFPLIPATTDVAPALS
jgi:hypothetical protein